LLDELLPWCYGELNLKPWEVERLCLADIFLMLDGWQRRYDHLEDIVISWITYPNVCIASGKKKRPELKSFFAHRKKRNSSKEQSEIAQDLFEEFGYELEYSESMRPMKNKCTGEIEETYILSNFYLRREFEDSELRLLIDSLLFSKHLPYRQCRELVGKLEKLSSKYFKSRIEHIVTMPQDRTNNQQLFYTIDVLDEAISHHKKVKFKYMEYNTDFSQTAKKSSSGEDRVYVVSPYQMAAKEGKYYLICNYDYYDDISNYRVDRISGIEMLDEKAKPFESLEGSNGQPLNLEKYMNEHIYMYSSDAVRVEMRIVKPMVSDMIDIFGTNITFKSEDDKHVTVSVLANEVSIVQFAKNFSPDVVVMKPASVRKQVIESLKNGLEVYEL